MSDYIERGKVIGILDTLIERNNDMAQIECIVAKVNVEAIPAADVEPVVRGELRINDQGFLECSACGKTLRMPLTSTYEMKRCYICGAHLERSGSGE